MMEKGKKKEGKKESHHNVSFRERRQKSKCCRNSNLFSLDPISYSLFVILSIFVSPGSKYPRKISIQHREDNTGNGDNAAKPVRDGKHKQSAWHDDES